jgi:hypothetical protein
MAGRCPRGGTVHVDALNDAPARDGTTSRAALRDVHASRARENGVFHTRLTFTPEHSEANHRSAQQGIVDNAEIMMIAALDDR